MKLYFVHVSGWAHVVKAWGENERAARAFIRQKHGFKRLPCGTKVWAAAK